MLNNQKVKCSAHLEAKIHLIDQLSKNRKYLKPKEQKLK